MANIIFYVRCNDALGGSNLKGNLSSDVVPVVGELIDVDAKTYFVYGVRKSYTTTKALEGKATIDVTLSNLE